MVFSSIPFLFYYLPCVLALYYLMPVRGKNFILLLASLFFYAWGEPKYLLFMVLSILQGYAFGLLIEKYRGSSLARIFLAASVVFSLGLLGYCKYADFFLKSFNAVTGLSIPLLQIALPIGISFYTFQVLSYTVDVFREQVEAQKNPVILALYVAMFPQLIAGPIVRYSDVAAQLVKRSHTIDGAALGIRRFILGLAKKVLLANALGELCSIFRESQDTSVLFYWLYAAAYVLHVYFDFSGYSDMAIGLGKLFGFDFPENFHYPYIAKSITEFWRRWHMTLGSWFRDYVYIPLGGNRVSKGRWMVNLLIVWILTGLWHGAAWNFVVWGLFFGVVLMIEKLWLKDFLAGKRLLGHVYVLLLVAVSFVIFGAESMGEAVQYLRAMFGASGIPATSVEGLYYLRSYLVILILAVIGATPLPGKAILAVKQLGGAGQSSNAKSAGLGETMGERILNLLEPIVLVLLLAISTASLVNGSFNPFLYFRF